jgi:signal transduction histidine kinase
MPGMASRLRILRQLRRPALSAGLLAALYVCGGLLYILFSGRIAADAAVSVLDLQRLELTKGIAFIGLTGVFLFVASWFVLRQLEAERARLAGLEWTLVHEEARHLPSVLAASMSHELKNLLQVAILQAEALAATRASDLAVSSAKELEGSLRRLAEVADRIHEMASAPLATGTGVPFRLQSMLQDICDVAMVHTQLRIRGLERRIATQATLEGNSTLLSLAVFNLILNAAAQSRAAAVRLVATDQSGKVQIEVHDDGPVQSDELRQRIFEPAFGRRLDSANLGLLSVRAAAESFGGAIDIVTSPLGGNCVRLALPVLPKSSP